MADFPPVLLHYSPRPSRQDGRKQIATRTRDTARMARKTPSRMDMRRMTEAAEARGDGDEAEAPKEKTKAKKAAAPRAKRTREKAVARKRLVWVVFNGSMKEEGRFPYDQKAQAEERIEQLRAKSKKMYFLQPVKEVIGEGPVTRTAPLRGEPEEELEALAPEEVADEEETADLEEGEELEEEPESEEPDEDEDLSEE